MKSFLFREAKEILKIISDDRTRTNMLKHLEQRSLVYLVQRIPSRIKSDMLTFIGFSGSMIIMLSFILAADVHRSYLLLGILGFAVNWFGDSLDGRLAYYRNVPRKWYGFAIDIIIDWTGIFLIGWGFMIYAEGIWEIAGYVFVVLYGWAIITALIRYKVTGKYTIDSGKFGPTEVRIIISAILIAEVLFKDLILYSSVILCAILFIVNIFDTKKLLQLCNDRDTAEREKKMPGNID